MAFFKRVKLSTSLLRAVANDPAFNEKRGEYHLFQFLLSIWAAGNWDIYKQKKIVVIGLKTISKFTKYTDQHIGRNLIKSLLEMGYLTSYLPGTGIFGIHPKKSRLSSFSLALPEHYIERVLDECIGLDKDVQAEMSMKSLAKAAGINHKELRIYVAQEQVVIEERKLAEKKAKGKKIGLGGYKTLSKVQKKLKRVKKDALLTTT